MSRQPEISLLALLIAIGAIGQVCNAAVSVGIDHDLTKPTYGLEGKSSSQISYDQQNGLSMSGTVADLLGPPIKIANGFNNILKGHNLANMGTGLKTSGALLGFDAKMLETLGAGKMLKGGFLLNGAKTKADWAGQVAGPKGQKIANIIEVPVKVVAVKNVAAGKMLGTLGAAEAAGAQQLGSKGQAMFSQGQELKSSGLSQMIQGASEGVQNIGNMVQKTSDNVNTAYKLLPLVWDMKQQQVSQQREEEAAAKGQQQQMQQSQSHPVSTAYQMSPPSPLTGGSLFGGLASLMPGLSSSTLNGQNLPGSGPNPTYAALWNTTSPLTNLLLNPGANPFLLPLKAGPLGQAFAGIQPIGTAQASNGGSNGNNKGSSLVGHSQSYDFSLFPGLKYRETISASAPEFDMVDQLNGKENILPAIKRL